MCWFVVIDIISNSIIIYDSNDALSEKQIEKFFLMTLLRLKTMFKKFFQWLILFIAIFVKIHIAKIFVWNFFFKIRLIIVNKRVSTTTKFMRNFRKFNNCFHFVSIKLNYNNFLKFTQHLFVATIIMRHEKNRFARKYFDFQKLKISTNAKFESKKFHHSRYKREHKVKYRKFQKLTIEITNQTVNISICFICRDREINKITNCEHTFCHECLKLNANARQFANQTKLMNCSTCRQQMKKFRFIYFNWYIELKYQKYQKNY